MKVVGKVMKFGDNVSTTIMAPFEQMTTGDYTIEALKKLTMTAIRPNFLQEVKPGMVIVAGRNWGFGSHREPANTIFKSLGIQAIVADSVSRIYFRNSVAIGMPILSCKGVSALLDEGAMVEIDFSLGTIRNQTSGKELKTSPLPDRMLDIIRKGGILAVLKEELKRTQQIST